MRLIAPFALKRRLAGDEDATASSLVVEPQARLKQAEEVPNLLG